uniref:Uncharacterized protein n=1 Tax=Siphoviridae sp. ctMBu2 TaxID=2827853 RepID=A0A8S5T4I5_9CAUD|nr:MAG TPA: hypothetical protein [Siphoviridae sp. ctMBu2]
MRAFCCSLLRERELKCCSRSAQASDFRPHHAGFFIARRQDER